MTFYVYPDNATAALLGKPPGAPIALANGKAMAGFAPLQPIFGNDPADNLSTSFISIAMNGPAPATPIQVQVEASNSTQGTTGAPVTVTATSIATAQALSDGFNATEAAAAYFDVSSVPNVLLLKVVSFISGTTLSILITNSSGAALSFVWVVGDSDSESQQPWLNLTPATLSFNALINQGPGVADLSFVIANYGTGTGTITGFTPALAAPYSPVGTPPTSVAPNQSVAGTIGFTAGATTGPAPGATLTLGSNDAGASSSASGHNNQLQLFGVVTKLEIAFVLDDSGSMLTAPDGTLAVNGQRRWDHLVSVANLSLDLIAVFGANGGNLGVIRFPGATGNAVDNLPSYDLVPSTAIQASMKAAENTISSVTPWDSTPMDYGLQRALGGAAPPYFSPAPGDIANDVRWMLLLSDGAWNVGADPHTEIGNLAAKNIKVFSVGFGTAGQFDSQTLDDLATGTGGQAYQVTVDPNYDYNQLASQFKAALKTGLTSLSSAADPDAVYVFGAPPTVHAIAITPYDTKVAFLITWDTPQVDRLVLTLQTPLGETLDPKNAAIGAYPGVTFTQSNRHALYMVDSAYLAGAGGRARYGIWSMIVQGSVLDTATAAVVRELERYAYDAIVESSLRLSASLGSTRTSAGEEIEIAAVPTLRGLPLTKANVAVEISGPGVSVDNWLAGIPITAAEYAAAKDKLGQSDVSALYIKAYVVQQKGFVYNAASNSVTIPLIDERGDGHYSAKFAATSVPGPYSFLVSAQGQTPDGVAYLRQKPANVVSAAKPDPTFTLLDWNYQSFAGSTTLVLTFTPRDRFGNVVLLDPARPNLIGVSVQGGATASPVTTLFDGAYSVTISYPSTATPSVSVSVLGVPLLKGETPPNPATLFFANRVFDYRPGLEAAPGANAHQDASAVLGDIRTRTTFLSLGAYGAVTVGVMGDAILSGNAHDVVVFVQPDVDRRAYRVDAQDADCGEWVEVGHSPGTTQAFRLPRAKLRVASLVRIVDLSGRTRVAGAPSATPGVSSRGVGFARVLAASYCMGRRDCCE